MLLRLRVRGFKNLRDAEVRFGPLTCFVGPNGVGKSNLFDAIQFLRALADSDIQTAAQSVRSPVAGTFGPRDLFWAGDPRTRISFLADMIVPAKVVDDFGREATPTTTLLRYEVELQYAEVPAPRLELVRESLTNLKLTDGKELIGFHHEPEFRKSVLLGVRRGGPLISTEKKGAGLALTLHADGGSRGRGIPAAPSPRTVVGGTNAKEYPTVLAAKREMASWQSLQLEPSVMRAPDPIGGPSRVDEHGGHIAAALARMEAADGVAGRVLAEASNRLATLVPDVHALRVDRDETRQQLSISARLRGSTHELGPRSLSDGTLRFLALVTMLLDAGNTDVLCMEEPENGMHPGRIPAMVALLRDFAVDPSIAIDESNPPRQVILNTHSPDVVRQLTEDEVLFVDAVEGPEGRSARVSALEGGWRKGVLTTPLRRMADFIGGSPLGPMAKQLELRFPLAFGSVR